MFASLFKCLAIVLFALVFLVLGFVVVKSTILYMNTLPKRRASLKRRYKHFLYHYLYTPYFKYWDFFKWVVFDIATGKIKIPIYGIWSFTGYFGQGKTLGAVTYALALKKKYAKMGINIHIFSNFEMQGQDKKITCWQDLMNLPRFSIVIFDEIQSTFTSQKFKDFPIDLLWKITQCRKNKLMVFASTPVFSRMTIQIRENTDMVVTCHNNLGRDRYFTYDFYRAPVYEMHQNNPIRLHLQKSYSESFIATNKEYRAYNTEAIVDRWDIEKK